jgi:hypothetical protein
MTTKASQVRFESTTQYEFSHGKKPSGFGVWVFAADFGDTEVVFQTPWAFAYADAKKWVKAAICLKAASESFEGDVYVVPMP